MSASRAVSRLYMVRSTTRHEDARRNMLVFSRLPQSTSHDYTAWIYSSTSMCASQISMHNTTAYRSVHLEKQCTTLQHYRSDLQRYINQNLHGHTSNSESAHAICSRCDNPLGHPVHSCRYDTAYKIGHKYMSLIAARIVTPECDYPIAHRTPRCTSAKGLSL